MHTTYDDTLHTPDALQAAVADARPVAGLRRAALEKVGHQVGGLGLGGFEEWEDRAMGVGLGAG